MADKNNNKNHLDQLGPLIFIVTLVIIIEFFWWFMHA